MKTRKDKIIWEICFKFVEKGLNKICFLQHYPSELKEKKKAWDKQKHWSLSKPWRIHLKEHFTEDTEEKYEHT